jgi:hypothetical protein
MHYFCESLSLYNTHTFRRDGVDTSVFCFAKQEDAEKFHRRFGGQLIAPKEPQKWAGSRTGRTDITSDDRQCNGRCINCDD